jgi:ribosomal protein L32
VKDGNVDYSWEPQYVPFEGYVGDIRKPFEECPHCGEYKLTKVRQQIRTTIKAGSSEMHWLRRLLAARKRVTVGYNKRDVCNNCGHTSDWTEEIKEEYRGKVEITQYGNVLKKGTIYAEDLDDGGESQH